eukprot:TRINITY_DN2265_c0_g2_i1.p1 TRINITY_DN2265_c0_g2~~TRINITY_DN2265_c0_g2_i1.p1  ORF type:complete len:162 (-),score=29.83 TRINITY_DN2265_c0_g2_i1:111-596(-)
MDQQQPQLNIHSLPPPGQQYNNTNFPPPGQQYNNMYVPPPPPGGNVITYSPQPQVVSYMPAMSQPLITAPVLGKIPQMITCPFCQQTNPTVVRHEVGLGAWLTGCGIGGTSAVVGGVLIPCLGCSCGLLGLIPCCMDDCRDTTHVCAACQNKIGEKKFLFS